LAAILECVSSRLILEESEEIEDGKGRGEKNLGVGP
jgi:hypothetical protein